MSSSSMFIDGRILTTSMDEKSVKNQQTLNFYIGIRNLRVVSFEVS